MTPADLRAICDSLNDERGTGGQSRLARLLGWHHSTVWRKLNGKSPITQCDELAIRQAVSVSLRRLTAPVRSRELLTQNHEHDPWHRTGIESLGNRWFHGVHGNRNPYISSTFAFRRSTPELKVAGSSPAGHTKPPRTYGEWRFEAVQNALQAASFSRAKHRLGPHGLEW